MRERLDQRQIILVRSLLKRGASMRPITIERWQRPIALPLWRNDIVEIWYRQAAGEQPSLQGPYFGLTTGGAQLASHFFPAPRGLSGAGD